MSTTFTKDGKQIVEATVNGKADKKEGTYKVDGDKIITTGPGKDGKPKTDTDTIATLTDTKLVIHDEEKKADMEFKKVKD